LFSKIVIFVMMIIVRGKIFSFSLQLIFLAVFSYHVTAQSNTEMRKIFAEAESCNLFEEYELANPLYLLLDKPDNFNIQYKIGTCYLNIPGEKDKAIPYLESAVKHSSYEAKINKFREKRAPLDAYFFLGKAYMINNDLEKALNTFQTFKKLALETETKGGMKNLTYIDQQIEACNIAVANQESPFRISRKMLGKDFRQGSINENPAVSFDGNTIVYTERRGILNALMFSKKIRGKWQPPVEINSQLKSGDDCSSCSLNFDGTLLFLYKTDNFDGNIYSSEYLNNSWTPIRKLNKNINTKYYESHASISHDGKRLYFTSNREGGKGGLDIYMSEKNAAGDWGIPVNLGNKINTIYNEDTPFITLNDSLLYFSSEGHTGMGGYDIFRSRGFGSVWEAPENMGFPINSTDDDRFFQPFNNDQNGYYSITTEYKRKDIFYLTLTNTRLNMIYELSGNYSLKDTIVTFDESNAIYLLDRFSGDTLDTGYPDMFTGKYNFIVAPGKFRLVYTGPKGYYPQIIDTSIVMNSPARVISLKDIVLDKKPSVIYEKLDLSDIPVVAAIDSNILIKNLRVFDVTENDIQDTTILYYTVQVMALYNPVDISYFKYVTDIKVFYSETDLFYRYTTGIFANKADAYAHRDDLISKGYPDDLFVKKVTRMTAEKAVPSQKYYTIQLTATSARVDMNITFAGLKGVTESQEIDSKYHYLYGRYTSSVEAKTAMQRKQIKEFKDAFVREIVVLIKK
jgi:tetratricopeptide (TPR) repeat protein